MSTPASPRLQAAQPSFSRALLNSLRHGAESLWVSLTAAYETAVIPAQRSLAVEQAPSFSSLSLLGDTKPAARTVKPFVMWVGGKRNIADEVLATLPRLAPGATYFEPFLGGGAIALSYLREGDTAVLSDVNQDLMHAWHIISSGGWKMEGLISLLEHHSAKHSKRHFDRLRAIDTQNPACGLTKPELAARLIYINKAGYCGIIKTNQSGLISTAYGHRERIGSGEKRIRGVADWASARDLTMHSRDFALSLREAQAGDVVFLDPPYMPISDTALFTTYTSTGFNLGEQKRLYREAADAVARGVHITASNSDTEFIRSLWSSDDLFDIVPVVARRNIGNRHQAEQKANEVLLVSKRS